MGFLKKIGRTLKKKFSHKSIQHGLKTFSHKVVPVLNKIGNHLPDALNAAAIAAPEFAPELMGLSGGVSALNKYGHEAHSLGRNINNVRNMSEKHKKILSKHGKTIYNHSALQPHKAKLKSGLTKAVKKVKSKIPSRDFAGITLM